MYFVKKKKRKKEIHFKQVLFKETVNFLQILSSRMISDDIQFGGMSQFHEQSRI